MDTTSSTPQDSSSSKRHFHWTNKVGNEDPQLATSETMSKIIEEEDTNTKEEEEQQEPEDDKAVPLPGPAATSQAAATKRDRGEGESMNPVSSFTVGDG